MLFQLPISQGGAEGKALYLDTSGSFRPERCVSIAKRYKMNINDVLQNIAYARVQNTEQQLKLLSQAAGLLVDSRFKLCM